MKRSAAMGWFFVLFVSGRTWPAGPVTPVRPNVSLPTEIQATLNADYPGWKLSPVDAGIQQSFKKRHLSDTPSIATGDFDRDGQRDYAVQIALTNPGEEEQIALVFLKRETGYQETILESRGLDPTVYLRTVHKAVSQTGPDGQEKLRNSDLLMIMGGPLGDATYAYQDGRFQEIKSKEDSENPPAAASSASDSER
jgi:hypothetical protein